MALHGYIVCFVQKRFAPHTQQLVNNKISRGIKTKNVGVVVLLATKPVMQNVFCVLLLSL